MPDIQKPVGDAASNAAHDVALVQAMLVLVKDVKGKPYLGDYDGYHGKKTHAAIEAFQKDHSLIPEGPPAPGQDFVGLVQRGGATVRKLTQLLPEGRKDLRVLDGGRTVYLPGTKEEMEASRDSVKNDAQLEGRFRGRLAIAIQEMWEETGIVIRTMPEWAAGRRRSFQKQYELTQKVTKSGKHVTGAGPGESNHNFGRAVDIGFEGLRWLKKDGKPAEDESPWLHKLKASHKTRGKAEALVLWEKMRAVATKGKARLNRGPRSDRPHLQSYADRSVSMTRSLAGLLDRVSTMKWERGNASGRFREYKCDFGLGGATYPVGSAVDIWAQKISTTRFKANYAAALTAAAKKARLVAATAGPSKAKRTAVATKGAVKTKGKEVAAAKSGRVTAAMVSASAVRDWKKTFRADFEEAEKRRDLWTPV